jgi:hypothetical protein
LVGGQVEVDVVVGPADSIGAGAEPVVQPAGAFVGGDDDDDVAVGAVDVPPVPERGDPLGGLVAGVEAGVAGPIGAQEVEHLLAHFGVVGVGNHE